MSLVFFEKLHEYGTARFKSLHDYLKANNLGSSQPEVVSSGRLKFSIGSQEFLFILEIKLTDGNEKYSFSTYCLVDDMTDYGKRIARYIEQLDIEGSPTGHTKFIREKISKDVHGRKEDKTIIQNNFGQEYIDQLLIHLNISKS